MNTLSMFCFFFRARSFDQHPASSSSGDEREIALAAEHSEAGVNCVEGEI